MLFILNQGGLRNTQGYRGDDDDDDELQLNNEDKNKAAEEAKI